MSIPKKGSRLVHVDNVEYRYLVKPDKVSEHDLDAEKVYYNHITIQIGTGHGRVFQYVEPLNMAVQPSDVKKAIEVALNNGWNPNIGGNAFTLKNGRYGPPFNRQKECSKGRDGCQVVHTYPGPDGDVADERCDVEIQYA